MNSQNGVVAPLYVAILGVSMSTKGGTIEDGVLDLTITTKRSNFKGKVLDMETIFEKFGDGVLDVESTTLQSGLKGVLELKTNFEEHICGKKSSTWEQVLGV